MTKKRTKTTEPSIDFEASLQELEKLVERMEKGELTLEESLRDFGRGIELTRKCQQALREAEQRVQILSGTDSDAELVPFDSEDSPE
ncbi:MAG TPA: exodeoxyribonuclease VII small subunit [Gammaproteobacteria bacterium]|nr:exodeoxyribonuclease VII small subunit [Gammaproteobacteria bacterium]